MCRSGAEQKRRRLAEVEIRESTERAFEAYGEQLELVPRFTYLGRVMTAGDDDWPAVAGNLKRRGGAGGDYRGYCEGRERHHGSRGPFSRRWCSKYCCSGLRRGWSLQIWSGR